MHAPSPLCPSGRRRTSSHLNLDIRRPGKHDGLEAVMDRIHLEPAWGVARRVRSPSPIPQESHPMDLTETPELLAFRARVQALLRRHLPVDWRGIGALNAAQRAEFAR